MRGRWGAGLGLVMVLSGRAAAGHGDLCFPVEGWALVGRWHVGSAARSGREGWAVRPRADRDWRKVRVGANLPAAACWLRATTDWESARWRDPVVVLDSLPAGARVYLNGAALEGAGPWPAALRRGTNLVALSLPPAPAGVVPAPRLRIRAIRRTDGGEATVASPSAWRVRADEVAQALPASWLHGEGTGDWRVALTGPLGGDERWLAGSPACVLASVDLPSYWRSHPVSLWLHGIPGRPDVWVNGRLIAPALVPPARLDLSGILRLDGHDTLCLAYAEPPPPGDSDAGWGVAAFHWAASPSPPRLPGGATLVVAETAWAGTPGLRNALRYAGEVLAVSATPWPLTLAHPWMPPEIQPEAAGALVSALSSTVFRGTEFAAALTTLGMRCETLSAQGLARLWIIAPPTAGRRRDTVANSRLQTFSRDLAAFADARGARLIPLYDVFRSALKRSRRWPVRTILTDDGGVLTPVGAYVAGLVVLDTLSLP